MKAWAVGTSEPAAWIATVWEDTGNGIGAGSAINGGVCLAPPDLVSPGETAEDYVYFDNFEIDQCAASNCNRISVVPRGPTGWGKRFKSDGTNISQTDYYDSNLLQLGSPSEVSAGNIALGKAPSAVRDSRGIIHLWYARGGNIYYRQDLGLGFNSETLSLSGFDCPTVKYAPAIQTVFMVGISGGNCTFIKWDLAKYSDIAMTADLTSQVTIGAADNICPAIEMLDTGALQVWYVSSGNLQSAKSLNLGVTWTAS
jgi:hypothetical protein